MAQVADAGQWCHDLASSPDLMEPESFPYALLSNGKRVWGWLVRKEKDLNVEISCEGKPYHLVFAFRFREVVYVGTWIADYSGWVHDDSQITRDMMAFEPGDPMLFLVSENPIRAFPFSALGVKRKSQVL